MMVLLDTNVLLLWVLGRNSSANIESHKRLSEFSPDHFDALTKRVADQEIAVTTCILAEASNLIGKERFQIVLKDFTLDKEVSVCEVRPVFEDRAYPRLGFTDTHTLHVARVHKLHLVTVDVALYLESDRRSLRSTNLHYDLTSWS